MTAQIKPFRFSLPKIPKDEAKIIEGLLEFLPATGARDTFHLAIRKALQKYIADICYYLDRIHSSTFREFFVHLPNPCCVAVLGMEPFKEKAFIEIDPLLSYLVLSKLLGGGQEVQEELAYLTETEQGVIEFLLLKLLAEIHKLCGEKARLHFRLERMILEAAHLKNFPLAWDEQEKQSMVCLKVHVSLLGRAGFVNIYLPHPWIADGFLKDLSSKSKRDRAQELRENIGMCEELPVELWGSLGEASLAYKDFKDIEEGDVVLFDVTGLKKRGNDFQGEVSLHVGKESSKGLKGDWKGFAEQGAVHVRAGKMKG